MDMLEREEFSIDDPTTQFCISSFLMQITNVGVRSFVSSWNAHPIPGFNYAVMMVHYFQAFSCTNMQDEEKECLEEFQDFSWEGIIGLCNFL